MHRIPRRAFLAMAGCLGAGIATGSAEEESEEKAMPPCPVIDTHVHVWDPDRLRYRWLDGSELLNRPYLVPDYREQTEAVDVDQVVFVQAECIPEQVLDEAAWVSGQAEEHGLITGIVASAPVELGDGVAPYIEQLTEDPLMRGVRRLIQTEREPGFCLQPGFVEGVRRLGRAGLTFDLGITRTQLPDVTELARRCPDVQFMVNHIGVPDIRGGQVEPWKTDIAAIADLPNVCCKMSGVATAADTQAWTREVLRPYIEHVLESFGFERVAFGSDWPVMLLATPFVRWVETLAWAVRDCSGSEQRRLWRETARDFYRLA